MMSIQWVNYSVWYMDTVKSFKYFSSFSNKKMLRLCDIAYDWITRWMTFRENSEWMTQWLGEIENVVWGAVSPADHLLLLQMGWISHLDFVIYSFVNSRANFLQVENPFPISIFIYLNLRWPKTLQHLLQVWNQQMNNKSMYVTLRCLQQ